MFSFTLRDVSRAEFLVARVREFFEYLALLAINALAVTRRLENSGIGRYLAISVPAGSVWSSV